MSWTTAIKTLDCIRAARARGRKLGKQAALCGLNPQAVIAADALTIETGPDAFEAAYRTIGHSCMSGRPIDARAYADASGGDYAIATLDGRARCVVRIDTRQHAPSAYGPDAGQLILGLDALGYTCAERGRLHDGVTFAPIQPARRVASYVAGVVTAYTRHWPVDGAPSIVTGAYPREVIFMHASATVPSAPWLD